MMTVGKYLQVGTYQYSLKLDDPYQKNTTRRRYMIEIELRQMYNYVSLNCDELRPFIQ